MAASNCREYMEEYYLDHKNYPNPEAIWFAASNYGRSQSVNQHTHDGSEASAQIAILVMVRANFVMRNTLAKILGESAIVGPPVQREFCHGKS
jgi:hypothetical protein